MHSLKAIFLGFAAVGVVATTASAADRVVHQFRDHVIVHPRVRVLTEQQIRARQLRNEADRLESNIDDEAQRAGDLRDEADRLENGAGE